MVRAIYVVRVICVDDEGELCGEGDLCGDDEGDLCGDDEGDLCGDDEGDLCGDDEGDLCSILYRCQIVSMWNMDQTEPNCVRTE